MSYTPSAEAKLILDTIRDMSKDGTLTSNDLLNIAHAANFYQKQQGLRNLRSEGLMVGSKVKFTSTKTGETIVGTLSKINQKRCIVDGPSFVSYTVPFSMLSKAE